MPNIPIHFVTCSEQRHSAVSQIYHLLDIVLYHQITKCNENSDWQTTVKPFAWYIGNKCLINSYLFSLAIKFKQTADSHGYTSFVVHVLAAHLILFGLSSL